MNDNTVTKFDVKFGKNRQIFKILITKLVKLGQTIAKFERIALFSKKSVEFDNFCNKLHNFGKFVVKFFYKDFGSIVGKFGKNLAKNGKIC